jgi:hypothetical protein
LYNRALDHTRRMSAAKASVDEYSPSASLRCTCSESRQDVAHGDAIYGESRHDVAHGDAIYSESRHDVADRRGVRCRGPSGA